MSIVLTGIYLKWRNINVTGLHKKIENFHIKSVFKFQYWWFKIRFVFIMLYLYFEDNESLNNIKRGTFKE